MQDLEKLRSQFTEIQSNLVAYHGALLKEAEKLAFITARDKEWAAAQPVFVATGNCGGSLLCFLSHVFN